MLVVFLVIESPLLQISLFCYVIDDFLLECCLFLLTRRSSFLRRELIRLGFIPCKSHSLSMAHLLMGFTFSSISQKMLALL